MDGSSGRTPQQVNQSGTDTMSRGPSREGRQATRKPPPDHVAYGDITGRRGKLRYFLDGITITTISVRMLKNRPRMPQPNGLRPLVAATSAHTIAAITLPIKTKIPLMPRRMKPAASGWL